MFPGDAHLTSSLTAYCLRLWQQRKWFSAAWDGWAGREPMPGLPWEPAEGGGRRPSDSCAVLTVPCHHDSSCSTLTALLPAAPNPWPEATDIDFFSSLFSFHTLDSINDFCEEALVHKRATHFHTAVKGTLAALFFSFFTITHFFLRAKEV